MRDEDRVRILHMIEAAEAIAQFTAGRGCDDLDRDVMLLFAIERAIEILGEAGGKVSSELQAETSEIPWRAIAAMRHRVIHGYFDIDRTIIWRTATEEVPALLAELRAIAARSN
jgi:uncharacterized protein with HEPN domain